MNPYKFKIPERLVLSYRQLKPMKDRGGTGIWTTAFPRSVVPLYYNGTKELVFRDSYK